MRDGNRRRGRKQATEKMRQAAEMASQQLDLLDNSEFLQELTRQVCSAGDGDPAAMSGETLRAGCATMIQRAELLAPLRGMRAHARSGPLPYDERELCKLTGCSTARGLRPLLQELLNKEKLRVVDGHLINGLALFGGIVK